MGDDSGDAFALAGGRVAMVVADTSGNGRAAAERIAELRSALRAFLHEHEDPSQALSCLNDFVCAAKHVGRHENATFATLTLAVLNIASGELTCLCAGGEPPLVLRSDGEVEVVQICGAALGLLPGQGYAAAALRLEIEDIVILMTDGLTEARRLNPIGSADSRIGPFFGMAGIAQLAVPTRLPQSSLKSLPQIGGAIFEGVRRFAGGHFSGDACLLLGQRKAASVDVPARE